MVDLNQVHILGECIARQFQPERIILFGSYAYGTPNEASDVDLLVVMAHTGRNARQAVQILDAVAPPFAVDLLVRTPEEMQQRLAWNDFFLREIVDKGTILYEVAHGNRRQNDTHTHTAN